MSKYNGERGKPQGCINQDKPGNKDYESRDRISGTGLDASDVHYKKTL